MEKNRHRNTKPALALVLTMLFASILCLTMPQQTYAAGGNATVTLGNVSGLAASTEFEFEMYKVGHYTDDGKFELDDPLKDAHVNLDYDKDDAEGWLSSAWTLSEYIDSNGIELEAIGGTHVLKPGESFTANGLDDGLYLVMSSTIVDAEDEYTYWTPQPVFVAILGEDSEVTLNNDVVTKIVRTGKTLYHRVNKIWEIKEGDEKYAKPSEINVNIRYGNEIIDTVKLTPANNWSYEWSSEESGDTYVYIGEDGEIEFSPADNSHKWTCDEIFTVEGFKEAYGRAPNKTEAAALKKLSEYFKVEILPDKVSDGVTMHRIKNVCKGTVPPPDTGDETNYMVWVGIFAAAVILLVVMLAVRRKSSEK